MPVQKHLQSAITLPSPPKEERVRGLPLRRGRAPMGAFLSGVLLTQIADSALHLAQPLLLLDLFGGGLGKAMGLAALFSSADTAVHMGGTFLGGWPSDRLGARRLLIASTLLRSLALALIPAAWFMGRLTLGWALAAYTLDALVRGFVDTSVHALPLELGRGDRAEYDRLNSRYEFVFAAGGVAGPALLATLLASSKTATVHLAIPAGFALAAVVFAAVPRVVASRRADEAAGASRGGSLEGLRLVAADRRLAASCLGLALLNIYPLRKLLSAFFAKAFLGKGSDAGWLGAAFGLGGALGSWLYARKGEKVSGAGWIAAGAAGLLLLAIGWIPGSLRVMLAASFLFAAANAGARLAVTRRLQEATPLETAGGVTALARFGQNAMSVALKALVGAAFALGAGPRAGFAAVGACLALLALAQLLISRSVRRREAWRPAPALA